MQAMKLGIYRHYKTKKLYEVLFTAIHSETYEQMVVYKALYECEKFGTNSIWTRPAKMFSEMVTIAENTVPRFELIKT